MSDGGDDFRAPDRRMITLRVAPEVGRVPRPTAPVEPPAPRPADRGAHAAPEDTGPSADAGVRPFVMTDGRTTPADERLRIETPVVATRHAADFVLDFERRQIAELCRTPLSVAEVGAALELPLAVARVLVADLVAIGAVVVPDQDAPPSRAVLERILERVHAL